MTTKPITPRQGSGKPPTVAMKAISTMDPSQRQILRWFSFPLFILGLTVLVMFLMHGGLEAHDLKGVATELGFAGAFVAAAILLVAKPQEFTSALLGLVQKAVPERFLTRVERRTESDLP